MVTVTSTTVTTTFLKSISLDTTFTTTSATYVDVTGFSIASVPDDAKIYFNLYVTKSTAGTLSVRITDGTNVFYEETGVGTGVVAFSGLDGSVLQNSGGAATVKVQVLSSDGNNASVNASTIGSSWIACCDMTGANPILIAPASDAAMTDAPFIFSGKRQMDELYSVHPNRQIDGGSDDEFSVMVNGMVVDPDDIDNLTVNDTSSNPNVITSDITIYPGHSAPIWASVSSNVLVGRGCVIVAWTGFNVEVTG